MPGSSPRDLFPIAELASLADDSSVLATGNYPLRDRRTTMNTHAGPGTSAAAPLVPIPLGNGAGPGSSGFGPGNLGFGPGFGPGMAA